MAVSLQCGLRMALGLGGVAVIEGLEKRISSSAQRDAWNLWSGFKLLALSFLTKVLSTRIGTVHCQQPEKHFGAGRIFGIANPAAKRLCRAREAGAFFSGYGPIVEVIVGRLALRGFSFALVAHEDFGGFFGVALHI